MNQHHPKVGIIGGGLAGVYTAYLLAQHNITYELIESKPSLGGRIYGASTASSDYKLDLGPSWIFPHQQEIQNLVADLGLRLVEQFTAGDAIFQRNSHEPPQQLSGVAPPVMYRILGGTTKLIEGLAQNIKEQCIRLSTTASSAHFDGQGWQIKTDTHKDVSAPAVLYEHLVIGIPPRVIAHKLSCESSNSVQFQDATSQKSSVDYINPFLLNLSNKFERTPTWMAAQAKFAVTYAAPFWREKGLSGQAFSHVGPLVEIHDASFEDANGESVFALFGFIGVPFAHRQHATSEQMKNACLSQLQTLFGPEAREHRQSYYKDWASDIFISTRLDQQQAPAHPYIDLASEQAQLKKIKLHLATSEFATKDAGYMEGAILAARRAVEQILLTL